MHAAASPRECTQIIRYIGQDVESKTHLVCTVPQYADSNLKTPVTVQVVLNCNGRLSEPRYFTYLPDLSEKSTFQHNQFNHLGHSNVALQHEKLDKPDWQYKESDNSVSANYSTGTNCNENSTLYHIMTNTGGTNFNIDSSVINNNSKFGSNKNAMGNDNNIQSNSNYPHHNPHAAVTLESTTHSSIVPTPCIANTIADYHQGAVGPSSSTAHLNYVTDNTQIQQSKLMQLHNLNKYESLEQLPPYNNDGILNSSEMDWTQSSTSTLQNDSTLGDIHNSSYVNSDHDGIVVSSANSSTCFEGYPNSLESNIHSNLSTDYSTNTYMNFNGALHKTPHHISPSSKTSKLHPESTQSHTHTLNTSILSTAPVDMSQCVNMVDASTNNNMTNLPTIEEQQQLVQQRNHQILTNL